MPENFWIVLVLVPTVTGLIGWGTNWAAVKMIFWPREFVGIGRLGWQGIVPRMAGKFATGVADRLTTEVLEVQELIERLDPSDMEDFFDHVLDEHLRSIVADAADILEPGIWDRMAPQVQDMLVAEIHKQMRELAQEIFTRVRDDAEELVDIHGLIVDLLSGENVDLLIAIIHDTAARELKFIEYYGGVFGLFIGLVQVAAYGLFNQWWIMPLVGATVGLLTNWLAIQMIFRPMEPTRILGLFTYQGMFPKRQPDIARDYGRVAEDELLTPQHLLLRISEGPGGAQLAQTVLTEVNDRIDQNVRLVEPLLPVEIDDAKRNQLKMVLLMKVAETGNEIRPEVEAYMAERMQVASTIEERLGALPKSEFEKLIRGIFEEDETTLILVGGVLGFLVGSLQAFVLYGLGSF